MDSSPASRFQRYRGLIDEHLAQALTRHHAALGPVRADADAILQGTRTLLQGGKRVRPTCVILGARAAGMPAQAIPPQGVLGTGSALELFHAAALLHDDVMDRSDTRRGLPALHRQVERLSRDAAWDTDHEQFGVSAAILAGDLCLVWSEAEFGQAWSGDPTFTDVDAQRCQDLYVAMRSQFDAMRSQLVVGQLLDMTAQAEGTASLSVERALRVAEHKTARYTIAYPMMLGALHGGADDHLLNSLETYGVNVGIAFQLRDDLLGLFGDPAQTGKPAGDDLREGKQTVVVALAHDVLPESDWSRLAGHLGDPAMTDADVRWVQGVLTEHGVTDRVEDMISELTANAEKTIAAAPIADDAAEELRYLSSVAAQRVS